MPLSPRLRACGRVACRKQMFSASAWGRDHFESRVPSKDSAQGLALPHASLIIRLIIEFPRQEIHKNVVPSQISYALPGPAPAADRPADTTPHDTLPANHNRTAGKADAQPSATGPSTARCSKDVTTHQHRPGARPRCPCPVPGCSGQPLSGKRTFSSPFRNRSITVFASDHRLPLARSDGSLSFGIFIEKAYQVEEECSFIKRYRHWHLEHLQNQRRNTRQPARLTIL